MDAGGKDGTIKHVFAASTRKASTSPASSSRPLEAAHDFLWRIHPHAPGAGRDRHLQPLALRGRLVTRVHKLIDKTTWPALSAIRDFEALLTKSGTTILKFFLHISQEEQLERFGERLDDPESNWKISESIFGAGLWDDYIEAFEDAICATSTHEAPWYVIPSNHKWVRNLAVSQIIADAMADLDLAFPPPSVNLGEIKRKYHAALERAKGGGKRSGRKKG